MHIEVFMLGYTPRMFVDVDVDVMMFVVWVASIKKGTLFLGGGVCANQII